MVCMCLRASRPVPLSRASRPAPPATLLRRRRYCMLVVLHITSTSPEQYPARRDLAARNFVPHFITHVCVCVRRLCACVRRARTLRCAITTVAGAILLGPTMLFIHSNTVPLLFPAAHPRPCVGLPARLSGRLFAARTTRRNAGTHAADYTWACKPPRSGASGGRGGSGGSGGTQRAGLGQACDIAFRLQLPSWCAKRARRAKRTDGALSKSTEPGLPRPIRRVNVASPSRWR